MLTCRQIVEQSSDYRAGAMPLSRRLQYRLHLLMCRNCRRFSRQFNAAVAMTRRLPAAPVSQAQIDAMLQRIDRMG